MIDHLAETYAPGHCLYCWDKTAGPAYAICDPCFDLVETTYGKSEVAKKFLAGAIFVGVEVYQKTPEQARTFAEYALTHFFVRMHNRLEKMP